jgi:hypothetical protein
MPLPEDSVYLAFLDMAQRRCVLESGSQRASLWFGIEGRDRMLLSRDMIAMVMPIFESFLKEEVKARMKVKPRVKSAKKRG